MPKAKEAAQRALAIDPTLAEPHISLGWASFTYDWDWPAATRHFEQARALDAAAVDNHPSYQFYLTLAGRSEDAVRVARQALARNPVSAFLSHYLSVQLALGGRLDEALAECRRTAELDPTFAVAYEVMAATLAAKGEYREALAHAEKAQALNPFNDYSAALVGFLRAQVGDREEARRALERLEAKSRQRYTPAISIALVHTGLGDRDRAFEWLEKAYEERSNRLAYLGREPVWESLHPDPRFDALVTRIGLPKADRPGPLAHQRRDVAPCRLPRPNHFSGRIHARPRLANGRCKRLALVEHAMLEDHERHLRVARGVGDGRKLLRAGKPFGRDLHLRAAVEDRLEPIVERRRGRRKRGGLADACRAPRRRGCLLCNRRPGLGDVGDHRVGR